MDYRTKPTSREELRKIAHIVRRVFKCKNKYYFDVVTAFEKMHILFPEVSTEVVSDDEQDMNRVPATTIPDMKGHYHIKIKEQIYDGAYFKKIGGYRNHILHEMCHAILFLLGFTPYLDRTYKNVELPGYESIEWQAKALAGEILVPYEETMGMSAEQIQKLCKVSKDCAEKRVSLDDDKKL